MKSFICSSLHSQNLAKSLLCAALVLGTGCVGEPTGEEEHGGNVDAASNALPPAQYRGYDSATGAVLPNAVTLVTKTTTGAESEVHIAVVASAAGLADAMSLSATLSVDFGFFGGFSKKWGYVSSLHTTQYSVEVVVYARQVQGTETSTNAQLTPAAKKVLNHDGSGAFVKQYGDSYISQVKTGGELFGSYVFYTQTESEQGDMELQLQQIIQQYGNNYSALDSQLSSFADASGVPFDFSAQVIGTTGLTVTKGNLITQANQFPTQKLNAATVIDVATLPYETLPEAGMLAKAVVNNRIYLTDTSPIGPAALMVAIRGITEQIDRVKGIYDFYNWHHDDVALDNARAQSVKDFTTLKNQMISFTTNPSAQVTHYGPNSFSSLATGAPSVNVSSGLSALYGSNGGSPFIDVPYKNPVSFVAKKERLFAVQLTHDNSSISRLRVWYAGEDSSNAYGNGGGTTPAPFILQSGTFINSITVGADDPIRYLKLTAGGSTYAGGTPAQAPLSTVTIPASSVLTGFSGRAGTSLDAIQFHWVTFHPSVWTPVLQ